MVWLAGYNRSDEEGNGNLGVDWVFKYEFGDIDQTTAVAGFRSLMRELTEAGLRVQVRHGHGASVLVCIRVPRDHLGKMINRARVKDWLYGITHTLPNTDENAVSEAENAAEEIRSVYHAVSWAKELGGAGIKPGTGKWRNITASFPPHDREASSNLLGQLSRKTILTIEDLDTIRALFGEKISFYYAFIQCYSLFLIIPAILGIVVWLYLGPYSMLYGIIVCTWSIVFVEYWKIRETQLSFRWGVNGVGRWKVTRAQFQWEKEIKDPITGDIKRVFPGWKQFLRQLLLIPFTSVAAITLGSLIVVTFALEVFISEVYAGPLKGYLQFAPTILFSLSLPAINSLLTRVATRLTDYENYRTQDEYDLAQTQKTFVMSFITSFLPIILTAFIYVPFGTTVVPYLGILWRTGFKADLLNAQEKFEIDTNRFQQEVIYLSMTAQVFSFGEEIVLPYAKNVLWQKWRNYRDGFNRKRSVSKATNLLLIDPPDEAAFLTQLRGEADAEKYKVAEDILEMCVQFGYLALFGVAWPLVPLGFLLNNWLELRGDFFKLTRESQRPRAYRADSIGPCILGLDFLAWMGTLSTAAIVHLYRGPIRDVRLSSLVLSMFIAEQVYLAVRFTATTALRKLFLETIHTEEEHRYAVRKSFLTSSMSRPRSLGSDDSSTCLQHRVRFNERVSVYNSTTDTIPSKDGSPSWAEPHDDVLQGSDREAEFWNRPCGMDMVVKVIQALCISEAKVSKVS